MKLKQLYRRDFLSFARKALGELDGTKLGDDSYLEFLVTEMMAFFDGKTRRLLVNLPPRHLKTQLFSVSLAAWKFGHQPDSKIMVVTYADQLAASIARAIRAILRSPWFKDAFATRVAKDHAAVMDFATTAGGALYAVSFGGGITGRGADLIIVDDPHDIKDAGNPQQLERTIRRFDTIVLSRLNNRKTGKVIVIAHRVHEDDLSAHLLRRGKWRHVVLPMVAMSDSTYATDCGGWRRRKGELLRPDAFDPEDLEELKATTHNPDFEMLYQQDADDRTLPPITEACFPAFENPPSRELPCVISIDTSMTSGPKNSFSVVQVWCPAANEYFLTDQWRDQCDYEELRHRVVRLFRHYRPCAILIEAAANGYALASRMKPKYFKYIYEITPTGSKTSRLRRHIETIHAQRILLPKMAAWVDDFVTEFVRFPHGSFTDQIDATTQFLDFIAERPRLIKPPPPAVICGVNSQGQPLTPTYSTVTSLKGIMACSSPSSRFGFRR